MTLFGKDIACTTQLRAGRFTTGPRLVGESLYRRLTTPRGMLRGGEDEKNFGFDLLDLIGSAVTESDAAALPGRIAAEAKKDERIDEVFVNVVRTQEGPVTSFVIVIDCTTAEGPFTLQLGVDDVTVELLGLQVSE